jgi:outer membrane lipopolysaccharide assembly protein LptE/RlpB
MLFLLGAAILLTGCTYSFRGQQAADIQSIAVPTLENESTEFGISETLTDELIRSFQRDGTLRVSSEDQADAILVGRVLRVQDEPYSARPGDEITVQEYRFSMTCEFDLIKNDTKEIKWTQTFPAWAVYPYDNSLANRDAAILEATEKLMQDILNKIVGNW